MNNQQNSSHISWYSKETGEVFSELATSVEGISPEEADKRYQEHGANRLTPPRKRSPLVRFFLQFHNVLIYVLMGAGFVTAFLQHWVDTGVIFGVVVVNSLIGFIQEGKAEKALEAISGILSLQAAVLRGGRRKTIEADRVTIGDVVLLQSGDKIPADLRLVKVKELRVDESALTGESLSVEKDFKPVDDGVVLGDRKSMAYAGTLVTSGQATGVVVAIGDKTELGKISQMLATVKPITTSLLRQIADFGEKLTGAVFILALASALFGVLVRNNTVAEMFLAAVGLAVAAIPEGLPAIITITLAIGVQRMAKRNAIIRLLPAVEGLGSVTVICSDKTGTLTKNEMTVQIILTADNEFLVGGSGYDPHGGFSIKGKDISADEHPDILEMARGVALCNDSELEKDGASWLLHGDPTEGSLLTFALKANLNIEREKESYPRTDIIPFESEHKFMATLHHDHAHHGFIYVKGAPERIIAMCDRERRNGEDLPINSKYWHEAITRIADRGQRLLAVAFGPAESDQRDLSFNDVRGGLTLLGLFGIIDPPRPDAIEAIKLCQTAGIKVKMITGDHAVTAQAIARQIGIDDQNGVVTGEEIDRMEDNDLSLAATRNNIFARVSPEHKLRLVMELQKAGESVAMTGDGVNDAPALKRADVGVAMGIKGTEVSKEAAEMVLADDNFASIVQAVKEGRTVYDNIRKAITFILPTNGGEAGIIIAAILSGQLLPITPAQVLWVNMITAVTLALTLAFEPAEEGIMERPPRDPSETLLSYFLVWRVLFVSLLLVIGVFGLFLWERMHGAQIDQARTIAVNTLVMFEVFYLFNSRSLKTNIWKSGGFFANKTVFMAVLTVIGAQLLYTYLPVMQTLFNSAPISVLDWLRIIMISMPVLLIVEIEKILLARWERVA